MSSHATPSLASYLGVFAALLVLTGLTTGVAFIDLGDFWNAVVALSIATLKALLVALFFMHLKGSSRLVQMLAALSLLWLFLLFALVLADYVTRMPVGGWS